MRGDAIAVAGLSRGGELALLLGATFPQIAAVVAGAPSSVLYEGLRSYAPAGQPAWTYRGTPLPYLASKRTAADAARFFGSWLARRPIASRRGFLATLRDRPAVERAAIAVERIQGPVLLVSGDDDQLWPSSLFAAQVMARLAAHRHPYPDRHLRYARAGHFVCFPYGLPSLRPRVLLSPWGGLLLTFGGSAAANAQAATDSWAQILAFLADNLPPPARTSTDPGTGAGNES